MEVLALDDGSTDGSGRILDAFAERDPRVRVIHRENRGLIATLNEGIARASGRYVARMDADDIAFPERLQAQIDAFEADPDLVLSGCNFVLLYPGDRAAPNAGLFRTDADSLRVACRFGTCLRHPTVMIDRERIDEADLRYDPGYPAAEDFDLFRRIADRHRIGQTAAPYLGYRIHPDSVSIRHEQLMQQTHVRILEENLARHYPQAAGTGFEAIADGATAESVAAAAELLRRLDMLAPQQPERERPSYDDNRTYLFYFFYAMLLRTQRRSHLLPEFLDRSGRWHMVRRRERIFLHAAPFLPGLRDAGSFIVNHIETDRSRRRTRRAADSDSRLCHIDGGRSGFSRPASGGHARCSLTRHPKAAFPKSASWWRRATVPGWRCAASARSPSRRGRCRSGRSRSCWSRTPVPRTFAWTRRRSSRPWRPPR